VPTASVDVLDTSKPYAPLVIWDFPVQKEGPTSDQGWSTLRLSQPAEDLALTTYQPQSDRSRCSAQVGAAPSELLAGHLSNQQPLPLWVQRLVLHARFAGDNFAIVRISLVKYAWMVAGLTFPACIF
jgi:hypothetical protein